MNQKYKTFKKKTATINFRNTQLVANELISAITEYKTFQMYECGEDTDNAIKCLTSSGTIAYRAMEHAYKNYIYYYYKNKLDSGQICQSEFDIKTSFLFSQQNHGRFTTHRDLKELFCKLVSNPAADLNLILCGAQGSNNGPKHNGEVPDPTKLKVQLDQMSRFFKTYITNKVDYPSFADSLLSTDYAWQELKSYCNNFSNHYQFILVAPPIPTVLVTEADYLFTVNWDLILDFDSGSDENGLKRRYIIQKKTSPSTRTLNFGDKKKSFRALSAPQWVMANGFQDQADTIASSYNVWKRKYGQNLSEVLRKFHSVYTKPIKVIFLPGLEESYVSNIINSCLDAFVEEDGETVSEIDIFLVEGSNTCLEIDSENVKRSDLTLHDLLLYLQSEKEGHYETNAYNQVPGLKPGEQLSNELVAKMKDFSEIVYIGIEKSYSANYVKEFYQGARMINWQELSDRKDIERRIYRQEAYSKIREIMNTHPKGFYNIMYRPGYGGTTILRRIAWDFHEIYPTIIINNYEQYDINYLQQLYEKTKLPLLILIDSNFVPTNTAKQVGLDLRSKNISHAIIYMRRIDHIGEDTKTQLFILPELEYKEGEVAATIDMLLPYAINEVCKTNLVKLRTSPEKCEERSPFYFALSAFDEEFIGIIQYIRNYMNSLSWDLKTFMVYIAIGDHINKPLDAQFFTHYLQSENSVDFLIKNLAFQSLVTYITMSNRQVFCKIKYSAFAKEILRQASNGFSTKETNEEINYLKLSDYVISFIEQSRPNPQIRNDYVVDFLREMLITRRADFDSGKPKFARLISEIGSYNTITHHWSQEGQAAVSRIFYKLTEKYPEDPHFRAHLARYLCYVEKAYDNAIELLDDALVLFDEEENRDPLLLHMKAMVYAARATQKTIPEIKKMHSITKEIHDGDELISALQSDLYTAQEIFKMVRKMHKGIAGHISDIVLCINVIDMGKALEKVDTATFLQNHYNDWYMELADHANNLFDECEELADDVDDDEKERIKDTRLLISTIRSGIASTISLYEQCLDKVANEKRPFIRRHLARAYMENNLSKSNQEIWRNIADLMEKNMAEEPENTSNIRTWFNAIIHIKSDDPDDMLRQAIIRLNEWVALSEHNVEAHYYRYILTFIQAVEGITDAESRLPTYLIKMRNLSGKLVDRTATRFWLGVKGRGIERLISKDVFPISNIEKASQMLQKIRGRISLKYVNDFHAYITAYKSDIFFNPYATDGRINESNKNAPVILGIGFSYDGPRAYNSSIDLYMGQTIDIPEETLPPLEYGIRVKCKVIKNSNPHFIDVSLVGYGNQEGSIPIELLVSPYTDTNRPPVGGPLLEAMVLHSKNIKSYGGQHRKVWKLTMKFSSQSELDINRSPLSENPQLKKLLETMKEEVKI